MLGLETWWGMANDQMTKPIFSRTRGEQRLRTLEPLWKYFFQPRDTHEFRESSPRKRQEAMLQPRLVVILERLLFFVSFVDSRDSLSLGSACVFQIVHWDRLFVVFLSAESLHHQQSPSTFCDSNVVLADRLSCQNRDLFFEGGGCFILAVGMQWGSLSSSLLGRLLCPVQLNNVTTPTVALSRADLMVHAKARCRPPRNRLVPFQPFV